MTFRPRQFRVGAMRERIVLQSCVTDMSTGQPERTWSNVLNGEPAKYEQVAGGEVVRGRQVEANVVAIFTVRYLESVYSVEQQIIHSGITYGITRVRPIEGGNRYIELHCKAAGNVAREES